jgi:hypothetical protein
MKWQNLVLESFKRQTVELEKALVGLTEEDLNRVPAPECNTIGWLAWHTIRSIDRNMSEIMGEEQLWIKDKWHARWSLQPDPGETGVGHTAAQVKAFKSPAAKVVLDYQHTVMVKVDKYIGTRLDENELSRDYLSPTLKQNRVVNEAIAAQLWHGANHIGQAGYARGLLKGQGKGKGWYGR